jgi:hypothetical protein
MAEITTNTRQPRVDMPPMVDLVFFAHHFFCIYNYVFIKFHDEIEYARQDR